MPLRFQTRIAHSILGTTVAIIVGCAFAAPGQAKMVETALQTLRVGQCAQVAGTWPGRLCVVRERTDNPKYVHFRLKFSGLVSHFNEQRLQSQSEIAANTTAGQSGVLYRRADREQIVTLKVQACFKRALGSSRYSDWAVLRIMN